MNAMFILASVAVLVLIPREAYGVSQKTFLDLVTFKSPTNPGMERFTFFTLREAPCWTDPNVEMACSTTGRKLLFDYARRACELRGFKLLNSRLQTSPHIQTVLSKWLREKPIIGQYRATFWTTTPRLVFDSSHGDHGTFSTQEQHSVADTICEGRWKHTKESQGATEFIFSFLDEGMVGSVKVGELACSAIGQRLLSSSEVKTYHDIVLNAFLKLGYIRSDRGFVYILSDDLILSAMLTRRDPPLIIATHSTFGQLVGHDRVLCAKKCEHGYFASDLQCYTPTSYDDVITLRNLKNPRNQWRTFFTLNKAPCWRFPVRTDLQCQVTWHPQPIEIALKSCRTRGFKVISVASLLPFFNREVAASVNEWVKKSRFFTGITQFWTTDPEKFYQHNKDNNDDGILTSQNVGPKMWTICEGTWRYSLETHDGDEFLFAELHDGTVENTTLGHLACAAINQRLLTPSEYEQHSTLVLQALFKMGQVTYPRVFTYLLSDERSLRVFQTIFNFPLHGTVIDRSAATTRRDRVLCIKKCEGGRRFDDSYVCREHKPTTVPTTVTYPPTTVPVTTSYPDCLGTDSKRQGAECRCNVTKTFYSPADAGDCISLAPVVCNGTEFRLVNGATNMDGCNGYGTISSNIRILLIQHALLRDLHTNLTRCYNGMLASWAGRLEKDTLEFSVYKGNDHYLATYSRADHAFKATSQSITTSLPILCEAPCTGDKVQDPYTGRCVCKDLWTGLRKTEKAPRCDTITSTFNTTNQTFFWVISGTGLLASANATGTACETINGQLPDVDYVEAEGLPQIIEISKLIPHATFSFFAEDRTGRHAMFRYYNGRLQSSFNITGQIADISLCQVTAVKCAPFNISDDNITSNASSYNEFERIEVECADGYAPLSPTGRTHYRCSRETGNSYGVWIGDTYCKYKKCYVGTTLATFRDGSADEMEGSNGSRYGLQGQFVDVGTTVKFSCDLGFELKGGDEEVTCRNRSYTLGNQSCEMMNVSCPELYLANAVYNTSDLEDINLFATVNITCQPGYQLYSPSDIDWYTCNLTSDNAAQWEGDAICIPEQPTLPPPTINENATDTEPSNEAETDPDDPTMPDDMNSTTSDAPPTPTVPAVTEDLSNGTTDPTIDSANASINCDNMPSTNWTVDCTTDYFNSTDAGNSTDLDTSTPPAPILITSAENYKESPTTLKPTSATITTDDDVAASGEKELGSATSEYNDDSPPRLGDVMTSAPSSMAATTTETATDLKATDPSVDLKQITVLPQAPKRNDYRWVYSAGGGFLVLVAVLLVRMMQTEKKHHKLKRDFSVLKRKRHSFGSQRLKRKLSAVKRSWNTTDAVNSMEFSSMNTPGAQGKRKALCRQDADVTMISSGMQGRHFNYNSATVCESVGSFDTLDNSFMQDRSVFSDNLLLDPVASSIPVGSSINSSFGDGSECSFSVDTKLLGLDDTSYGRPGKRKRTQCLADRYMMPGGESTEDAAGKTLPSLSVDLLNPTAGMSKEGRHRLPSWHAPTLGDLPPMQQGMRGAKSFANLNTNAHDTHAHNSQQEYNTMSAATSQVGHGNRMASRGSFIAPDGDYIVIPEYQCANTPSIGTHSPQGSSNFVVSEMVKMEHGRVAGLMPVRLYPVAAAATHGLPNDVNHSENADGNSSMYGSLFEEIDATISAESAYETVQKTSKASKAPNTAGTGDYAYMSFDAVHAKMAEGVATATLRDVASIADIESEMESKGSMGKGSMGKGSTVSFPGLLPTYAGTGSQNPNTPIFLNPKNFSRSPQM